MSTKRSHILKQICSFQLQVCLSMCDILVGIRYLRVKKIQYSSNFLFYWQCSVIRREYIWIYIRFQLITNFIKFSSGESEVFFHKSSTGATASIISTHCLSVRQFLNQYCLFYVNKTIICCCKH